MTPEGKIKQAIRRYLESQGALVIALQCTHRGLPDLVAIDCGRTLWLEVKTPKGRTSRIQEVLLRRITDQGGEAYVVRSLDDVRKALDGSYCRQI